MEKAGDIFRAEEQLRRITRGGGKKFLPAVQKTAAVQKTTLQKIGVQKIGPQKTGAQKTVGVFWEQAAKLQAPPKASPPLLGEQAKKIRAMAGREGQKSYTTAQIQVDMSGMVNRLDSETDIDALLGLFTEKLEAALYTAAEGVHV